MSNLLNKALCNTFDVEELVHWLLINDTTVLKDGVSQFDFVTYLLEFLRKHTKLLLLQDDLPVVKDLPENESTKSPIHDSSVDRMSFLNSDRNSKHSVTKRYNSPKEFPLEDFIVIKAKPKQKHKKIKPFHCSENNQQVVQSNHVSCLRLTMPANNSLIKLKNDGLTHEHKNSIKKLALLYSASIASNLIQDLLKELNYVISLLTTDRKVSSNEYICQCSKSILFPTTLNEICLFKIASEGRYFACVVLENQWNFLKYLNKSTLKILEDNESISTYASAFAEKIKTFICESKADFQNVNILNRETFADTVKFQIDTDSKSNYVNEQSFLAFKKQRDEFYSLLQDWQNWTENVKLQQTSTNFFKIMHKRLRTIFTINSASTNMFRLADLFVSQILASVFNENFKSCEKLSSIGIPMTKFDLLNRRFVTPCSIVVDNEKRFPGIQEFFKDFLRSSAENSFFLSHVRDVLVQRITTLNNFKFSCEVAVTLQKQELFLIRINKLCLLAKFLSLITFLPYQDEQNLPFQLRIPLAEARQMVLPPFDLDSILKKSFITGRMIITIPWIVEFLNGIDKTSVLLPCYKVLFAKLQFYLYKIKLPAANKAAFDNILIACTEDVKKLLDINSDRIVSNEVTSAIRLVDILELANDSKNDFINRFADECLVTINCSRILITLYVNSLFNNVSLSSIITMQDISSVAEYPILISSEFYIGETALYQCCPQLHEIKYLLEGNKKLSFKSIIPKMEKTFCEQQNNEVSIDVLMETHFFDNMPKSVKKCVDFVSERMSSLCVKSICETIIPVLKTEISAQLTNHSLTGDPKSKLYAILKQGVKEELSKLCNNIEVSIRALMEPEVMDESIINICVDISCRKCIEIVYNWIFNYINFNDMINKEREIINDARDKLALHDRKLIEERKSKKSVVDEKKIQFLDWMMKNNRKFSPDIMSPIKVLHTMRGVIRRSLTEYSGSDSEVFEYEITSMLKHCLNCITYRSDLQFIAFRRIIMISLELCIILVFYNSNLISENLLRKFDELWAYRKICHLHLTFEHILSCRSMDMYQEILSEKQASIRKAMTVYIVFTVNHKLLHVSRLFTQILKLLRQEWSKELLTLISICLNDVLQNCETGHEKIKSAIELIANFIDYKNDYP